MTLAHVAVVIENPPTTGESGIRFLAATDQCGQLDAARRPSGSTAAFA